MTLSHTNRQQRENYIINSRYALCPHNAWSNCGIMGLISPYQIARVTKYISDSGEKSRLER